MFNNIDYPVLAAAYSVCKNSEHSWYVNILNFLDGNGLGFLKYNPNIFTEDKIIKEINTVYENQYIQSWDMKAKTSDKYKVLYHNKENKYSKSCYLSNVINIDDRRMLTKLRVGCSNIKTHKFLGKNENSLCSVCNVTAETLEHLLFSCSHSSIVNIQNKYLNKIQNINPIFEKMSKFKKLCFIMNLNFCSNNSVNDQICMNLCISFIKEILKFKNSF